MFYALVFGIINFLPSKHLKNRTQTGLEAVSGPGPVRFGPGPEYFSPVRSGTPGTLLLSYIAQETDGKSKNKQIRFFWATICWVLSMNTAESKSAVCVKALAYTCTDLIFLFW